MSLILYFDIDTALKAYHSGVFPELWRTGQRDKFVSVPCEPIWDNSPFYDATLSIIPTSRRMAAASSFG